MVHGRPKSVPRNIFYNPSGSPSLLVRDTTDSQCCKARGLRCKAMLLKLMVADTMDGQRPSVATTQPMVKDKTEGFKRTTNKTHCPKSRTKPTIRSRILKKNMTQGITIISFPNDHFQTSSDPQITHGRPKNVPRKIETNTSGSPRT